MTATNNPQAATGPASAAYRNTTDKWSFSVSTPPFPRACALLPRRPWHRPARPMNKDAFDASLTTFERSFDAAGQGAAAFNRKIVDIARRNVDANFNLATSLAGAKNLGDIVELQSAFWRKQFGVLTSQAEEVRVLSTKVTADAVEQVKRGGVHELRKAT